MSKKSNFYLTQLKLTKKGMAIKYLVQAESDDVMNVEMNANGDKQPNPELINKLTELKALFLQATHLTVPNGFFSINHLKVHFGKDESIVIQIGAKCMNKVNHNEFDVLSPRINLEENYFSLENAAKEILKDIEEKCYDYIYKKEYVNATINFSDDDHKKEVPIPENVG